MMNSDLGRKMAETGPRCTEKRSKRQKINTPRARKGEKLPEVLKMRFY